MRTWEYLGRPHLSLEGRSHFLIGRLTVQPDVTELARTSGVTMLRLRLS